MDEDVAAQGRCLGRSGGGEVGVGNGIDDTLGHTSGVVGILGMPGGRVVHEDRAVVLRSGFVAGAEQAFGRAAVAFNDLVEDGLISQPDAPAVRRVAWAIVAKLAVREEHQAPFALAHHDQSIGEQTLVVGLDVVGELELLDRFHAPIGLGGDFDLGLADLDRYDGEVG